jgi:hypothetical protein
MAKTDKTTKATTTATSVASVTEKCACQGCKSTASRFSFCDEHYDHFKFGLIKKSGEAVSDYDKKYGHYVAYKQASTVRKAA